MRKMVRRRYLKKDPKTGKHNVIPMAVRRHWSEHLADFYKDPLFHFYRQLVDEDTELRKKLLEETFVELVKKRYAEEYLKASPETPTVKGFQDFIKRDYVVESERNEKSEETAVVVSKKLTKKGFEVVEGFSEYTIFFEYKDGQLIYDDVHADEVFDAIWSDIDLITEFVSLHLGGISKERIKLFRQYLMEDAEAYPNANELKQQIKTIFLPFETADLIERVREDILEEIKISDGAKVGYALEVFTAERIGIAVSGVVPYEDTRQTWRQPFAEQYGLKLWTTLYEKVPLPDKSIERIRRFLMSNFFELFLYLIPYEVSGSKKLEQDIAANNPITKEFKRVLTELLDSSGTSSSILITQGGYGKAAYLVTKNNLSMLYADELALKEVYAKYSSDYPELKALFKKMYRWTKDTDEQIELEKALQKSRDKALKKYLYSYEEELAQEDIPARRLLKKVNVSAGINAGVDIDTATLKELEKEGYQWNQQQIAM